MRALKILIGAVLLLTLAIEGVNSGLLLMNVADDAAVVLGAIIVCASVFVPVSLAGFVIRKGWA